MYSFAEKSRPQRKEKEGVPFGVVPHIAHVAILELITLEVCNTLQLRSVYISAYADQGFCLIKNPETGVG